MSNNTLDNEQFDVVVLGTGLIESIIANELASSGQQVLHVDRNPFYGGNDACFTLSMFIEWAIRHRDERFIPQVEIEIGEALFVIKDKPTYDQSTDGNLYSKLNYFSSETIGDTEETVKTRLDDLLANDRQYTIEMVPKLALCRSKIIDLIVDNSMSDSIQFKAVEHNYFIRNSAEPGLLEQVPESKEDIFASDSLTLIEKRKLMKLMTTVTDSESLQTLVADNSSRLFVDVLKSKFKLSGKLLDAVVYAVAKMTTNAEGQLEPLSVEEGCGRVQKYAGSIGRYGRMAYLCAMYGGGSEISQALCRQCAVAGGTYVLGEKNLSCESADDGLMRICLEHGCVKAKTVVMDPTYTASPSVSGPVVSRAIWILDSISALKCQEQEMSETCSITYISGSRHTVSMLYVTQSTMSAPANQSVLYAWTNGGLSARRELLKEALSSVIDSRGCQRLFTAYYQVVAMPSGSTQQSGSNANVHCTNVPDSSVDFDSAVDSAQGILGRILMDE